MGGRKPENLERDESTYIIRLGLQFKSNIGLQFTESK